jgi:hypothetical protein
MSTLETNLIQPSTGTTLTVGASGDTVTAPSGVTVAGAISNTPMFYAFNGIGQSVSSATWTTIANSNVVKNSGSNYNNSTYAFTAPNDGSYHFDMAMNNGGNSTSGGYIYIRFLVNGSTPYYLAGMRVSSSVIQLDSQLSGSLDLDLNANDTVVAQGYVESSSPGFTDQRAYFCGHKLIGA